MKKLSVIIPVYNTENYLSKCLDSILAQDIPSREYEIIIIDDGSTDKSYNIIKSYSAQNQNIRVFNQNNVGVGSARNLGIREADGKYLMFVDSDDFILMNCLNLLVDQMEINNLDLLRYNYEAIYEDHKIIPKTKNSLHTILYNQDIVDGSTFISDYLGWACYLWLYIYNTSFIKKNNLLFNSSIYFEDIEWLIHVLMVAKRVLSYNKKIYFYLQRPGSITKSIQIEKKLKVLSDRLFIVDYLKNISKITPHSKVKLWCNGLISLIFMSLLAYVENELPSKKNEVIGILLNPEFYPLKSYKFTFKQKRDLFLTNLSPRLYCYIKKR